MVLNEKLLFYLVDHFGFSSDVILLIDDPATQQNNSWFDAK
jgi:hypothetical protein